MINYRVEVVQTNVFYIEAESHEEAIFKISLRFSIE